MSKNNGVNQRVARALYLFRQGYNCSQSVFAAFSDICGLSESDALKLSSPLGAGIGRMREVCGAFCGASLVAGYLHGNDTPTAQSKGHIFSLVRQWADEFKEEFGSLYCRDLLKLSPEDLKKETHTPNERTPEYYHGRPCERCILFATAQAALLLETHSPNRTNSPSYPGFK